MTAQIRRIARALVLPMFVALFVQLGSHVWAEPKRPAQEPRAPIVPATIAPPRAPAPCELPATVPSPISYRWMQLGGAKTLGCYDGKSGPNLYVFRSGRIMDISATYRSGATLAAVIDAEQLIHLYWQAPNMDSYANAHWLVRLSYDGAEVNQRSYAPGDHPYGVGSVQDKYGEDVIVHPGGRHGTLQVGVEACGGGGLISSSSVCLGWGNGTLTFEM